MRVSTDRLHMVGVVQGRMNRNPKNAILTFCVVMWFKRGSQETVLSSTTPRLMTSLTNLARLPLLLMTMDVVWGSLKRLIALQVPNIIALVLPAFNFK